MAEAHHQVVEAIRAPFDAHEEFTVGLEEEVFLVDGDTWEPVGAVEDACDIGALEGVAKLELPSCQVELLTPPAPSVSAAVAHLGEARRRLLGALRPGIRALAAGVLPVNARAKPRDDGRYRALSLRYGRVLEHQLVAALHVHVAVPGADRVLRAYDGVREYLPLLAAYAANAPIYERADSGMASVRPLVGGLLPRQGIPPRIPSWERFRADLAWAESAGSEPGIREWWWEARLHPVFGTLELRVPDAQTSLAGARAVCALVAGLVGWASDRPMGADATTDWRLHEARWWAARGGVDGELPDPVSGERAPVVHLLEKMIGLVLESGNDVLGAGEHTAAARAHAQCNGATTQRQLFAHGGTAGLMQGLVELYSEPGG